MGSLLEDVAQRAIDLDMLTERNVQEIFASFGSRTPSLEEFKQAVTSRELLTNYQFDRLVKGERTGFFFGDYKVLYLVGTGTFARVFRAVHRKTGQVFAVKVLRQRFSEMAAQYTLFLREGELGCSLRHPNIVPIYEVHSSRSTHFLVMEFIEGRSLREFIKIRKSIEPVEATRLMIDITSGLNYAFQKSVTHRDLKASNVLVSSRGQAKLLDFGLAGMDDGLGEDSILEMPNTRTVDYAALERATGVRKDDARSDIYFAGCIYYHMLVGKPPLPESQDRVQRLCRERFYEVAPVRTAAPQVPLHATVVVERAMALDPEVRYQNPREFLADLHRLHARLTQGEPGGDQAAGAGDGAEAEQRSVMVVESNARMQDLLRDALKKAGYRVLVTSDPDRAFDRARQDAKPPDCLLFSAPEIGEPALATFNRLATDPATEDIPAILLLDEHQKEEFQPRAQVSEHRVVLSMPITLKQLRTALGRLMPGSRAEAK